MSDKPKPSRHEKRVAAFKLVFAREFDKECEPAAIYESFLYENSADEGEIKLNKEYSSAYVKETFFGICENLGEIDAIIEETSVKWKISRMSVPTKTVLRLAVYELLFTDTPPKVAINEAVEIIKEYDDESAPAFVNGILNNIARSRGLIAEIQTTAEEVK